MEKKRFWFLDVTREISKGKSEIWVWGLTDDKKRILLINKDFRQVFFLAFQSKERGKVESFLDKLSSEGLVISYSFKEKNLFGKPLQGMEIECTAFSFNEAVKKMSREFPACKIFFDDINFTRQYLLFKDLSPSSWYETEVERGDISDWGETYFFKELKKREPGKIPDLRILSADFIYTSSKGEPNPERDPVAIISVATSNGSKEQFILRENEKELLHNFVSFVKKYDPDIIVTFKGNSEHFFYLVERSRRHGLDLGLGRMNEPPHPGIFGHVSISGRLHFDLKDYINEIPSIQLKTLKEMADFFGLTCEKHIDDFMFPIYWQEGDFKREELRKYSIWRAETILKVFNLIMNQVFTLSQITGLPADQVFAASPGFRLENYLMREALKRNELIPKSAEKFAKRYIGGKVISPKPGLHSKIAVIDFKSMYPSLMIKYNISPDTIIKIGEAEEDSLKIEEAKIAILQKKKGFFTQILEKLIEERDLTKKRLKEISRESVEYSLLDVKQKNLKILANAMYGYMGWTGARWFVREGAEAVAFLGRKTITESINKAEELGLEVIYADTDSLFVKYNEEKVNKLMNWVREELGLEIKIDKIYEKVVFTEAKKKYAGITSKGELDIVGLEVVRSDWCNYARETQKKVLEKLLIDTPMTEIFDLIKERVNQLQQGKFKLEDLIIWEQITRSLDEYKANAPHIQVAKNLVEKGWEVKKGDFVGYVICKGEGKLFLRSKHYTEVKKEEVDVEYYIKKQVIPVCTRVLRALGVSEKQLEQLISVKKGLEAFF